MDNVPLILDFDASVQPFDAAELRLNLRDWEEAVRFGTTNACYRRLGACLTQRMPNDYGCVFTGSGDFHHLSLFLLRHLAVMQALGPKTLDVVVCDNHPDNMRYLFGLHCGSWVRRAAALPAVRHIHVVGMTSPDITATHAWENYLTPFLRKKLTYWSVGIKADWLRFIGRGAQARSFASAEALLVEFLPVVKNMAHVYLSLDKDVLTTEEITTNWDQGVFRFEHLKAVIAACGQALCGADVCGDISYYRYKSAFKNMLAGLDGQSHTLTPAELNAAQEKQRRLNRAIVNLLQQGAARPAPNPPVVG